MRALIDRSVPHAERYYSTYLSEPSPAGDISLSLTEIAAEDHLSLVRVLEEMKDVGASGELLVASRKMALLSLIADSVIYSCRA